MDKAGKYLSPKAVGSGAVGSNVGLGAMLWLPLVSGHSMSTYQGGLASYEEAESSWRQLGGGAMQGHGDAVFGDIPQFLLWV